MANLLQEFNIHPVGQGLFYSGKITHNNEVKFRMVFDCGSKTAGSCEEELEIYRDADFLKEKIIDLLVISHFDADHVNQIGNLLNGNIKVKKLVMPFLTFEERLFLVLRYFSSKSPKIEDDFFIKFALDPLNTINENLDGDSQVIIIESGPNEPIDDDRFRKSENSDSKRFEFDFKDKEEISPSKDIFTVDPKIQIFKTDDSKKGILFDGMSKLMEFIFYRKKVHKDEKVWYDKITEIFYEEFKINGKLPEKELFDRTIDQIKKIKSATKIKTIFKNAKYTLGNMKGNLDDLNTTSLCLLHKNLRSIFKLVRNNDTDFYNNIMVNSIHKFAFSRIKNSVLAPYIWNHRFIRYRQEFIYPNALLTSDIFLLNENDVNKFIEHYKKYWGDFWLFQIPHHGSEKSSNDVLHSHLTHIDYCFINYGIGNINKHPNTGVIHNLIKTGNSTKIIPINQILGLHFELSF